MQARVGSVTAMTIGTTTGRIRMGVTVDDVRVGPDLDVVAHTLVRGGEPDVPVPAGALPLAITRSAAAELVEHTRGPGWHVAVREVAVLRVFRPLTAGDLLTTTVTCQPSSDDDLVASGRCLRGDTVVATVTMRLAVLPDHVERS
jgi:hypothetical protein